MLAAIVDCSVSAIDNVANLTALKDISKTDTLTGIYNRRSFENHFSEEVERCKRLMHPLALILIDIDNLKRINKQHGHDMGDRVLKDVARLVKNAIRRIDIAARYDEDEFAVLMPHTTQKEVKIISKRIYDSVMNDANQAVGFMINVGIGSTSPEKVADLVEITKEDLLKKKKSE
jgi:diguanylate cyclase (GGDEF)-like protein